MIAELMKALLDFLKLAPRYLVPILIADSLLLFTGEQFLKTLGMFEFAQNYRPILGLIFILVVSILIVYPLQWAGSMISAEFRQRKLDRRIPERLNRLTEDEKQILRFYILNQTRANTLRIQDGVVHGLVAEGIIYRSAAIGNLSGGFAHNISDPAWNYLNENPRVLDGRNSATRTDREENPW